MYTTTSLLHTQDQATAPHHNGHRTVTALQTTIARPSTTTTTTTTTATTTARHTSAIAWQKRSERGWVLLTLMAPARGKSTRMRWLLRFFFASWINECDSHDNFFARFWTALPGTKKTCHSREGTSFSSLTTSPDMNLLDTFFWSALKGQLAPLYDTTAGGRIYVAQGPPDSIGATLSGRWYGQASEQLAPSLAVHLAKARANKAKASKDSTDRTRTRARTRARIRLNVGTVENVDTARKTVGARRTPKVVRKEKDQDWSRHRCRKDGMASGYHVRDDDSW